MKAFRRLIKNRKGIDTILAALLMVVIVVVASVMVYAWSTGLLGALLVTPTAGKENLGAQPENVAWASNGTTVSLYIRNSGSVSASLATYYVKDAASNQWAKTTWVGPTIAVNQVVQVNIAIGLSSGATCSPSGCAFTTFQPGNSYTITVVTSRNNPFVYTVVR